MVKFSPGTPAAACLAGFTLLELLVAVAILAVLAAIGVPAYLDYVERARVNQAITDIRMLNVLARKYEDDHHTVPPGLGAIGAAGKLDPWGRPYVYLRLSGPGTVGQARKNKNLVPINSGFDLYSAGKDGASLPPLTAKPSLDDVVLANDGGFVGLAAEYVK
jgi:general secretion pathway protein G